MPKAVLSDKAANRSSQEPRHRSAAADGQPGLEKASPAYSPVTLLDAALLLEPELRTLHGVLVALRHLGERADPIDPPAIAVLSAVGEDALYRINTIRTEMEQGRIPDPDVPASTFPGPD